VPRKHVGQSASRFSVGLFVDLRGREFELIIAPKRVRALHSRQYAVHESGPVVGFQAWQVLKAPMDPVQSLIRCLALAGFLKGEVMGE
jgi:hypothetical protein